MQLEDAGQQLATRPSPNPTIAPGWANNDLSGATPPTIIDPDCQNAILAELGNLLALVGLSMSKTDVTQVFQAILGLATMGDVGAVNALAVNPAVALPAPAAIRDGTLITVVPAYTNTGSATLAVSGGAAQSITYPDGGGLGAGDIAAGVPAKLIKRTVSGSPVWWLLRDRVPQLLAEYDAHGTYTFTVPSGVYKLSAKVAAGGASGAGYSSAFGGGGGGAGGYAEGTFNCRPGDTITCVVGAGGAAVAPASGGADGNNGASSSISSSALGAVVSCTGGGLGVSSGISGAGGKGGYPVFTLSSFTGAAGGDGGSGSTVAGVAAGNGGASFFGGGTQANELTDTYTGAPGSGGGGSWGSGGANSAPGADGIITLWG